MISTWAKLVPAALIAALLISCSSETPQPRANPPEAAVDAASQPSLTAPPAATAITPTTTAGDDAATTMMTTDEPEVPAAADDVTTVSDAGESTIAATTGSDIDEYLDTYEEYMDMYLKALKKIKNNDLSAMQSYSEMMAKAQEMQKKLAGMKVEMNASHIQRLNRLNEKMLKAAAEM